MRGVWWLGQARVSWTFPRPHSIWQQWHCHSPHHSTAYNPGSRKWIPHQAWCRWHPLQSRFGHRWARTHPYTLGRYSLGLRPALSYATACFVNQQLASWVQDGVSADTTPADIIGVLARFLEDIMVITRDQKLGLLRVEPFTFHASLPRLDLGDTLFFGVEKFPWYTSAKLMQECLQYKLEQWFWWSGCLQSQLRMQRKPGIWQTNDRGHSG